RRDAVKAGAVGRALVLDDDREAYAAAVARRDVVAEHRDDSGAVSRLQAQGVRVIKTRGRIEMPGVVSARAARIDVRAVSSGGELRLGWQDLVIATGARPVETGISGVDSGLVWNSEQFYSNDTLPARAAVIGGGAVGCGIAPVLNRFGCRVLLIHHSRQLVFRGQPAL